MERARLGAGLYEAVVTAGLESALQQLDDIVLHTDIGSLANAEASDRLSRHVGRIVARAIEAAPDGERAATAIRVARSLLDHLGEIVDAEIDDQVPVDPGQVQHGLRRRRPDGTPANLERPLTPLLDTTVLTNAPGEPAVLHELRAEVASADSIDVVMAFVRWSGVRPLLDTLRQHCDEGKRLRVLTTSYTKSTEARALEELDDLGAEVRVSYDTSSTRLHAKAWLFNRQSGYSTAYVGSSNLTHSAQVTGIEWNLRVAEACNPDAIAKFEAVFETYWENHDFVPYDAAEFQQRTRAEASDAVTLLSPVEIELRPFQERLLDLVSVARRQGHHRNLLVAATGTGKTVMAAVDYARLRRTLPRSRLLFVAHRREILEQSRAILRHALRCVARRSASCG